MDFRISDTFTSSLARLEGDEQKLVKTTAFDLQLNPANPGHQFHKLDKAKDPRFWSVRVSRDIRLIVHRTDDSLLLCYAAHHDDAYRWAERRKLEVHPKTGAAQIVEIREIVREVEIQKIVEAPPQPKPLQPPLFAAQSEESLLSFGVPPEWIQEALQVDEDGLFELAGHLPAEAAEALLELAVGGTPQPVAVVAPDPFSHPDSLRRFRVVANVDELAEALDYSWEKWAIFLHPAQKELVERDFAGPARVSGSAGTGKTVVALHRAVHLARASADARVLLATFSPTLANQLRSKVRRLLAGDPRLGERIDVADLNQAGKKLYEAAFGKARIASNDEIESIVAAAAARVEGHRFGLRFLMSEWHEVVDAWQIASWEAYRDVRRLGRKIRLPEAQRAVLWSIFEHVIADLANAAMVTPSAMFTRLASQMAERRHPPYEFAVIDEAQDVSIPQLKFLAALGGDRPNSLFFAGDLGQRIFQSPFSWLSLGVDVRGRSKTLKINYRTSHQIRSSADRLLDSTISDADGLVESRHGAISVFDGPEPEIHRAQSEAEESTHVAAWLKGLMGQIRPQEVCLIVRTEPQFDRAIAAASGAGIPHRVLDDKAEPLAGHLNVCTMHLAKGLEFRAVAVMACDDEIIPLQERIETVGEAADLDMVYNTERQLLYVACTRARDRLLVTSGGCPSEFLQDMAARQT